jgi:hypothetical protein
MYSSLKSLLKFGAICTITLVFIKCEVSPEKNTEDQIVMLSDFEGPLPAGFDIIVDSTRLEVVLGALEDSAQYYLNKAMAAEKLKADNSLILIDEYENSIGSATSIEFAKNIESIREKLVSNTYDSITLGDLETMESYDSINEQLVAAIYDSRREIQNHDKHVRANLVINEIVAVENEDFITRKKYNDYAKTFNMVADEYLSASSEYKKRFPVFYGD